MESMNPAPEEILNIDEAPVVQSENVIIENEVLAEIACLPDSQLSAGS